MNVGVTSIGPFQLLPSEEVWMHTPWRLSLGRKYKELYTPAHRVRVGPGGHQARELSFRTR
jgi:hypothetical protein